MPLEKETEALSCYAFIICLLDDLINSIAVESTGEKYYIWKNNNQCNQLSLLFNSLYVSYIIFFRLSPKMGCVNVELVILLIDWLYDK